MVFVGEPSEVNDDDVFAAYVGTDSAASVAV